MWYNKKNDEIKKYPIYYHGEKYEIRLKIYNHKDSFNNIYKKRFVIIYKVKEYKIFFKKIFKYKKVFDLELPILTTINKGTRYDREPNRNSEDYYVELFNAIFKSYIQGLNDEKAEQELEKKQIEALENWHGIIE